MSIQNSGEPQPIEFTTLNESDVDFTLQSPEATSATVVDHAAPHSSNSSVGGSDAKSNMAPEQSRSEQSSPSSTVSTSSGDSDSASSVKKPGTRNIISAVNVHKTYLLGLDGVPALRGVSLDIKEGEFIVILGKSGGGKTSLLNILGTIDRPSKGELYIAGKRITSTTTDDEFAQLRLRHIGFVFQQFNLISSMTALENVMLPMILDGRLPPAKIQQRAQELLDRVGVGARATHVPSQLSGGEQQRVTIARAIANAPSILMLDEPTGDLDTRNTHRIMQLLIDLNRKEGITCVMVTHDQDLRNFAHRVVHVMDGKILRIEIVPEEVRQKKDAELRQKIKEDSQQQLALIQQKGGITEYRDTDVYYADLLGTHPTRSTEPPYRPIMQQSFDALLAEQTSTTALPSRPE